MRSRTELSEFLWVFLPTPPYIKYKKDNDQELI